MSKVDDAHQHLRPPHHPRRGERRVPRAGSTTCCSATTASTTRCSRSLDVPYEPARWHPDQQHARRGRAPPTRRWWRSSTLINMYRVRGHLIANLDPLGRSEPHTHPELDIAHYGLSIWDLDREFPIGEPRRGRLGDGPAAPAGHPRRAARRVRAHHRRRVHAHPGARPEELDPAAGRGRRTAGRRRDDKRRILAQAQRGRGVRAVPAHQVPRPEALQPRRGRDAHPDARRARLGRRRRGHAGAS